MKLKDKIALCSGKDMWHTKEMKVYDIPSIMMCDGPHGLRKQVNTGDILGINQSVPATSFPTAVSSACSFDEELLERVGRAIGKEANANDVSVVLGPGANIKRNPLCGRNFEYFSEDPYLTGKMAGSFIRGVESVGCKSTIKHFALNNQEYKRFSSDSIVDERTMREIYLSGFEMAIKEGRPSLVMSSYNKLNDIHTSENKELLTDILRNEWGFDGLVVTDWGGMTNRIKSFEAGCDLCMPGGSNYMEKETYEAVLNHELDEKYIDQSVERVLKLVHSKKKPCEVNMNEHDELAYQVACESAVLLKNDNHLLPIKDDVLFVGHMAKKMRYQGSGSSHIQPYNLTSVLDACPTIPFVEGYYEDGSTSDELIQEACDCAKKYKNVVIFAGLSDSYESEGFDREHMKMPNGHLQLIQEISKIQENVIIVLMCGSAIEIPWNDSVKSILYMGLCGQAGGRAIVDLLFGKKVPCGKLAETWPIKYEDCISSSYYSNQINAQYREGIYVGYRYYSSANIPVCYPFGHGLSYTTFVYSNIQLKDNKLSCTIKNTGKVTAKEIVQLYIEGNNQEFHRPKLELKGFKKIELQPNESKEITFEINDRSLSIWNHGWIIPNGTYKFHIASSSENIKLTTSCTISGNSYEISHDQDWYTTLNGIPTQEMFEKQINRKIIEYIPTKGNYTMENSIQEMSKTSKFMKFIYKTVEFVLGRIICKNKDYNDPTFKMMMTTSMEASLCGLKINIRMKNTLLEGFVEIANGHILKGFKKMIVG